ncbi:MAG: amidohydrolase family protein [Planctomycetota bacterium]|nr:amidohydrolase family protein [Planctomycetota bacterium]
MMRLLARWIFPVDQPPIERGVVEISDGVISAVEPLPGQTDSNTLDLGNVAIVPGLVNAHAHLEFSNLDSPIEPALPFTSWIGRLLAHRRERAGSLADYTRAGSVEAAATGSTLVGDIVTGDWFPGCVSDGGPSIVAFRELIGLLPDQEAPQLDIARQHIVDCLAAQHAGHHRLLPAISPHAPYSVSLDLFHRLVNLAAAEDVPLCIHLAETRAELELLNSGTGEFFDMLTRFDLWRPGIIPKHTRPLDYLLPLGELPHSLIAHGNYLADDEIDFLATHPNVTTVFCPRTHAFFDHADHPWERLLDAGASICIGTDGRSSNPDYSLWSEMQFLARQVTPDRLSQILEMGTLRGSRSLGAADISGTITLGTRADLCIISLGAESATDPWSMLFEKDSRPVATLIGGKMATAVEPSSGFHHPDRELQATLRRSVEQTSEET